MSSKVSSLLVQEGRVPARRMADAFQRQVIFGGALDTILLEMGLVPPEALAEALARAYELPFTEEPPSTEGALDILNDGYTAGLAERFSAVPMGRRAGKVRVLVKDPLDPKNLEELGRAIGFGIEAAITFEYRYYQALEKVFSAPLPPRYAKLASQLARGKPIELPASAPAVTEGGKSVAPSLFAGRRAGAAKEVSAAEGLTMALVAVAESAGSGSRSEPRSRPVAQAVDPTSSDEPAVAGQAAPAAVEEAALDGTTPGVEAREPQQETADLSASARRPLTLEGSPPARDAAARTLRHPSDPAIPVEIASPRQVSGRVEPPPLAPGIARMSLSDARATLQTASSRDLVFEVLCRVARERFAFAAIFVVHGESASPRVALGRTFLDTTALEETSVDLHGTSTLRTAITTRSPVIGRIAADDAMNGTLRALRRPTPAPAALLPIVLRDRAVAVLYADNDGRSVEADEIADVVQATAEAAKAFLRIIQSQKKGLAPVADAVQVQASPTWSAILGAAAAAAGGGEPVAPGASDPSSHSLAGVPSFDELPTLISVVERGGAEAAKAAERLLAGSDEAAWTVASYFPGPLRFGHRKASTISLPLDEHGPLVALAARFGERIVAPLMPLLDDPAPDVRFHAVLVLGEIHSERAISTLGDRLFDSDAAVRRAAAWALSRCPPSLPLAALLERLRDEVQCGDLSRERAATFALGELRDVPSVPRLIDLLKHRDMEVVESAHRALVVITKQDLGTTRWRWRSWWEKARNLSRIEWLLDGLEQPSVDAQRSAAEELQAIGTARFGCHARFSTREREEAAGRFAAWHAEHPHVLSEESRT